MPDLKTTRGLKWNYELQGEGEALLFIHGLGANLRMWAQQLKHFSQKFKVLSVNLPGHGKSDWQPITMKEMAEDIIQIMDEVSVGDVGIIGSSFGGQIGLAIARDFPNKVRFLNFVGSFPKFLKSETNPVGLELKNIRKLNEQFDGNHAAILDIFFRSLFTREERQSDRYKWIKQFRKGDDVPKREALKDFLSAIERVDLTPVLKDLSVPVQFINGTGDYICPVDSVKALSKACPDARYDFMEGCGHFPFLTKPEEFNKLLEEFIVNHDIKG